MGKTTESMYVTRGVYCSTLSRLCGERGRGGGGESESELGLSNVARGLVYSRASDDNVHAALNLPLLPPSSWRFPFSSFLFTFALYHIPFLPSYVPEYVASRCAHSSSPPLRLHSFLSPLLRLCRPSISFLHLFALTLCVSVSPLDAEKVRV